MSRRKPVNYHDSPDSSVDKSFDSLIKESTDLNVKESSFSINTVRNTPTLKNDNHELSKLKQEISNLKEMIQNLELQCQMNGIIPVTQGGSLKKRNKTEEKIQEIEEITREIKKCLGIDQTSDKVLPHQVKPIKPKSVQSNNSQIFCENPKKHTQEIQKSNSDETLGSYKDLEEMSDWILSNETPGPTEYDVKTSLLDENKHKHFGFIEKASRFQENARNTMADGGKDRVVLKGINENVRPVVKKNDDAKLKQKEKGWKEMYSKITKIHEKEIKTLEEKISRIETMFQTVVKEKSHLVSSVAVKEKEFLELQAKHEMLLLSLEKADKVAQGYVDKACKADTYEKKLNHVNKATCKMKNIADKKLLQENEELYDKVAKAEFDRSSLEKARKEYKMIQKELNKSCESFETQRLAYLGRINDLESELENITIKNQHALNEIENLTQTARKVELERNLESDKCAKLKSSLESLEGKVSEISIMENNLAKYQNMVNNLSKQKENLESEIKEAEDKYKQVVQKMEAEIRNLKGLLKEQKGKWELQIQKSNEMIQELTLKQGLADTKLMELKQENESSRVDIAQERLHYSKQKESSKKVIDQLEVEVKDLRKMLADNESNFEILLEKERQISAGLSQKTRDQFEKINSIEEKYTACLAELENERAEYKMNISIMKSSMEKSETDFKIQISQIKNQLNEAKEDIIKKEEYYQSIASEEKKISAGLSCKVRDQAEKIRMLENHVETLKIQSFNEKNVLNDDFIAMETKYQDCYSELKSVSAKLSHLETTMSSSQIAYSNEVANMRSKISDLEFLKENLNSQVQESQTLIQEQNAVIQKLEDSLNDKSMHLQSFSQQNRTMEEEMKDLLKRFTTIKVELEEEKNLHGQTKQLCERKIEELEKELNENQVNFSDKDRLLQSFLELEKQNALAAEKSELGNRIASLEKDIDCITKEAERSCQTLQTEVSRLNSHNEQLNAEVVGSVAEIARIKDAYQSMEASMTANIKNLESKNKKMSQELSDSVNLNAEHAQMIEKMNVKIQELNSTISIIEEKLCTSNEELKQASEKIAKLELEVKEKTNDLRSYENKIDSLDADLLTCQTENESLMEIIETLKEDLNSSINSGKEKDTNIQNLDYKVKELEEAAVKIQAEFAENNRLLELNKTDLEKDLSSKTILIKNLQDQIKLLESTHMSEMDRLQNQLHSYATSINRLETDVASKDGSIKTLNEMIDSQQETIHELEKEKNSSLQKVTGLQGELEERSVTQEKLIESISHLKSELAEKHEIIKSLEDRIREAEKGSVELKHHSQDLTSKIDQKNAELSSIEAELSLAMERIQLFENNAKSHSDQIRSLEDQILDFNERNLKLSRLVEKKDEDEKIIQKDLQSTNERCVDLESKLQSQKEDFQSEFEKLKEISERERKSLNDRITSLKAQFDNEVMLKEKEMRLCEQISDKLDVVVREKQDLELKLDDITTKYSNADLNKFQELKIEVGKLNNALEFKSNLLKDMESQLEDAQSRLSVAELRLLNELSSKDMHFKTFEDRLKSKCTEVENLTKSHLEMKKNVLKLKEENKTLLAENEKCKTAIARYKEVERLVLLEKTNLEHGHKDTVTQVEKYKKEISNLKTIVKELTESNSELSHLYASQSEFMSSQGALNNSEMEKISNLNAELAGHSNSRQKIKYVSNIKQENLALKRENSNLLREREQLNQRIQSLLADKASLGPII